MKKVFLLLVVLSVAFLGYNQHGYKPKDLTAIVKSIEYYTVVKGRDTILNGDGTYWINDGLYDSMTKKKQVLMDITFDFHSKKIIISGVDSAITYGTIDTTHRPTKWVGGEEGFVYDDDILFVESNLGSWWIDYHYKIIFLTLSKTKSITYNLHELTEY